MPMIRACRLTGPQAPSLLAPMSPEAQQDFALAFLSILFEGAPFILLGTLISGFIDIYLPPGTMERFLPKNKTLAVLMAGLMGAIFPVCECAVVPVIRRLVRKGLPVSCGITYMLAAPIVNPITALSTWKAFQGQGPALMTSSRLLLGFLLAVAVGLIVSRMRLVSVLRSKLVDELEKESPEIARELADPTIDPTAGEDHREDVAVHGHDHEHEDDHSCCGHEHGHEHGPEHHHHGPAGGTRLVAAFRSSMKDFVDVGVYFTIGVAITSLFNTGIAPGAEWLDTLAENPVAAPAALMTLAFILSLCSTSDAFIAATLDKFSWGAKLAFLTFGPMMDVKLIFLYQTVLRKNFIIALAVGLFLVIGGISIVWQYLLLNAQ
jgi:uncharacterized protein